MATGRIKWIDVAKGIGIIAVVLGHSGNLFLAHYIYWFHMPLFFLISGYLHKQPDSFDMFVKNTRRKTCRLLVPYVSFYCLILVIEKINYGQAAITLKDFTRLLFGGQLLGGFFASFWFITVLYLTQIAFSLLLLNLKTAKAVSAVLVSAYILSYLDSLFSVSVYDIKFLWNADVVLLAVVFYSAGWLLKNKKVVIKRSVLLLCSFITCITIILDAQGIINYSLDMRSSTYNHFLLDLLVPVGICMMILQFSRFLEKYRTSKYLMLAGRYSLPIMYLHLTINIISDHFYPRNFLFVTIIGVVIPILLSKFIFEKSTLTKFLFLGIRPNKVNIEANLNQ